MKEDGPLKEMKAAAKQVEDFLVLPSGDELFEGREGRLACVPGRNDMALPVFRRGMTGPGIVYGYVTKAVPDNTFQSFSARLTEPAEKKFMRKADREYGIRRKREGKRGEPCFIPFVFEMASEPLFYLHGVGNKASILPFLEGGKAPFWGI